MLKIKMMEQVNIYIEQDMDDIIAKVKQFIISLIKQLEIILITL